MLQDRVNNQLTVLIGVADPEAVEAGEDGGPVAPPSIANPAAAPATFRNCLRSIFCAK
jgi:hypothetical protein